MEPTNLPKILCVDDEMDLLDSLKRTLRRRFDVLTAQSPDQAEVLIEDHPDISVIVSDHIIGKNRGVDFLKKSRSLLPLVSRVLLSGQVEIKTLEEAINSGVIHKFILKPWENDQLLMQIVEAHKNHQNLLEQNRLKVLSITDPVTQLTNHRFFHEKLRLEWKKAESKDWMLSLMMVDVDHFKKFNDRFGHPDGDKLLLHIATVLKKALPDAASFSRYGGDEFAIILPNTTSPEALSIAEKTRNVVLQSSFQNYPLSLSLGVATAPEHASSVDELIIAADQSLLQAKRRGRNQTVVGLSFDH